MLSPGSRGSPQLYGPVDLAAAGGGEGHMQITQIGSLMPTVSTRKGA
jgi:hypothetical protein